jgi:hypothetical protein
LPAGLPSAQCWFDKLINKGEEMNEPAILRASPLSTQNTNVSVFPNLKMSVLGSGGGRARRPGVAQRPTDARCTALETALVV